MASLDEKKKEFTVITAGMVVVDIISAGMERFAHPGEMMFVPHGVEVHIGGHPADVAIDLANLGLDPGGIGVIAAVGTDIFGDFIEETITSQGIHSFLQRNAVGTSKNMIFIIEGEDRRFHLDPGANLTLEPEHVKQVLSMHTPEVFCCRPGYSGMDLHMESILKEIPDILRVLDFCNPYNKPCDYITLALRHVDVFHSNSGEAMKATDTKTPDDAVRALLDAGIPLLLITSGHEGAQLTTQDFTVVQRGFSVNAIDPTGAGDAFCAGFIKKILEFGISKKEDLSQDDAIEALLYAQAAGAVCASAVGCTTGVSQAAIQDLLQGQGDTVRKNTRTRETKV